MTPQALVERFLEDIGAGRWAELADFYAEDAVVEQPLNIPEPTRLVGREAVRRAFAAAGQGPLRLSPRNLVVHTTADPEVVIAEYDYDVSNITTGRGSTVANVQLFRVRDGQFVATRDYHDHWRLGGVARSEDVRA
jgi:ketosteroid isomerase-like protein